MALQTHLRVMRRLSRQLHGIITIQGMSTTSGCTQWKYNLIHSNTQAKLSNIRNQNLQRNFSSNSAETEYRLEPSGLPLESFHARDIFKVAINAVEPRYMVESVLQFDGKGGLSVQDKSYRVDHNVFVVGFGKAVLGMARATEDILGEHVVSGILSIPRGQRQVLKEKEKSDLLLKPDSKITVYEGGQGYLPDTTAHEAALAIEKLLSCRRETDLVIVLVSGGGSPLLPCPQEPVTLDDLISMTQVLVNHGATIKEMSVLRKSVERLKGGKMVDTAYPAQMVSLIISDVVGDPMKVVASGPTVYDEVTAHQCFEILNRLKIHDKIPASIIAHLDRQMVAEAAAVRYKKPVSMHTAASLSKDVKTLHRERVQNVVVGSNDIACQAAVTRALELGQLPYILSTSMGGEAQRVGATLGKLGLFMLMCFDRNLATQTPALPLELDIIRDGVTKRQLNEIITLVDTATNMGRDAVIICGGESVVNIRGDGMGGRNLEVALGASLELQRLLKLSQPRPLPAITLLSADTDGEDGPYSPAAGAVVTENFQVEAERAGFESLEYLKNNDTYSLFRQVKGGSHLVVTRATGTNVMDIQVLIVRNPLRSSK